MLKTLAEVLLCLVGCFSRCMVIRRTKGFEHTSVQVISNTELKKESLWQPTEKVHANIPYLWRCGVKFKFPSKDQEDVIGKYIDWLGIIKQIVATFYSNIFISASFTLMDPV